jgi:hypothetical protein
MGLIGLGIVLLVAIIGFLVGSTFFPAHSAAGDNLSGTNIGQEVTVVGQIVAQQNQVKKIEILTGQNLEQRTGIYLKAEFDAQTTVAMGILSDVTLDTVAQFKGIKTAPSSFRVTSVAILNAFVPPPPTAAPAN